MSHTPGPWQQSGDLIVGAPEPRQNPKVEPYPHSVAKLCWDFEGDASANGDLPWKVASANGRLIAAAPELFECLVNILDHHSDLGEDEILNDSTHTPARELISRLKGISDATN